jgi:hypothetical protein
MVILTRKVGQAVRIVPDADLGPAMPVGELFFDGPISVILAGTGEGQARLRSPSIALFCRRYLCARGLSRSDIYCAIGLQCRNCRATRRYVRRVHRVEALTQDVPFKRR